VTEDEEVELEALMRQRRIGEARLNRALNELLGTGRGTDEVAGAIEEMENVLRGLAGIAGRISS
jgi:hypothetical protein